MQRNEQLQPPQRLSRRYPLTPCISPTVLPALLVLPLRHRHLLTSCKRIPDVWLAVSNKAAQGEAVAAHPFVLAHKLQKSPTADAEQQLQEQLIATCNSVQATIMRELAHVPQSGAWLLTLPSQRAYRLHNDQYLLAVRKRLGMLPDSSLLDDW